MSDRFVLVNVGLVPLARSRVLVKRAGLFYVEGVAPPVIDAALLLFVLVEVEDIPNHFDLLPQELEVAHFAFFEGPLHCARRIICRCLQWERDGAHFGLDLAE
jgi:hypothetical protein